MVGKSQALQELGAPQKLKSYRLNWRLLIQHQSLRRLRWLLPLLMAALVVVYEFLMGHVFQPEMGLLAHELSDILIFGTLGPILTFVLLDYLDRFVQERETSDLQAEILRQIRQEAETGRELTDEAIQIMFSTSTLIDLLKQNQQVAEPALEAQIEGTEKAIDEFIRRLRSHLMTRR